MINPKPFKMKRIFTLLLLIIAGTAAAQQYNNEWIKYPQTYYKFRISSKGLYRIPKSALTTAGIGNAGAEFFELWRNGVKVPIYTSSSSGPLAANGFIEFWGEPNDGKPDKALYRNPTYQHTTELSLLCDTAVYFLSVNTDQSGFRFNDISNNVSGNALPAEPYFMYRQGTYFANKINLGFAAVVGEYVYSSAYDRGEFWSSNPIRPGTPLTTAVTGMPVYTSGPDATLKFGVMGDALNPRSVKVSVNGNLLEDSVMDYFMDVHTTLPLPVSMISAGTANVTIDNTSAVSSDRIVASYFEINYPRTFDFSNQKNFKFSLPASGAKYLEISNFDYGSAAPLLLNLTTGERITGDIAAPGLVRFALAAGGARDFVLVSTEAVNIGSINNLTQKTFKKFSDPANQGDYLIISNPVLFSGANGTNPVDDYRTYRSSAMGGGYNAQVVDINELVDQFGFGIKKNPLSIKNFLRYARNVFSVQPKYVFIIGRGVTYSDYRKNITNVDADNIDLVPTFGYPGSDNMLSSADAQSAIAVTPIGRLSVVHAYEVADYLEKIKEYENTQKNAPNTIEARSWMKNVLHVTGSSDPYLGTVLCNYMGVYRSIISDTSFGGQVHSFCKASTNTIEQLNSERISKLFEEGISILTYFGHSSTTTLEFNLDNPENYNNQGKYPVFFVNGCNAGNFFTFNTSRLSFNETLSEKFTLAKQRGGIAFVASTHYGIVNYLNIYLNNLYASMAKANFGKPLSILTRDALQKMMTVTGGNDFYARAHAEQITLHGDPAILINELNKPDYVIEEQQVKINPAFVSVAENSFRMKAVILNNGKAVADSIIAEIKWQRPDGTTETVLRKKLAGIRYADSISLEFAIVPTRDKGSNKIIVTIDADQKIDEVTESNNTVTKEVIIFEDEARATYPANFAIINDNRQKLYASTANPLSQSKTYKLELDTTELFNSSMKISRTLTSVGGALEFDPGITYQDSMVYYWRVASMPASGAPLWSHSSFRYINGPNEGFGQGHYFQHTNSSMNRVSLDSVTRKWVYGTRNNTLFIRNGVFPTAAQGEADLNVSVNDIPFIASACVGRSILFNVFDPVTFQPWKNVDANNNNLYKSGSGSANCDVERHWNFEFSYMTPASRKLIMNFMDSIPAGFYVVARSFDTDSPNSFSATWRGDTSIYGSNNSIYHRLLAAGMMNIDSINSPRAWIFAYKKDDQSYLPVYYNTQGVFDRGSLVTVMKTPDTVGTITSPLLGPAKAWKSIVWNGFSQEGAANDNPTVEVIGVDASKNESVLTVLDRNTKNFDLSFADPVLFPYMKLRMRNIDSITLTPYQLSSWMVLYTPVPEGAIAPNILYQAQDTLQLGEKFSFAVAFRNISKYNFDSLAVKLNILDNNNVTHPVVFNKQKPLISGDTVTLKYEVDSKDYNGANTLYLEFNPDKNQPELYQFNNFIFKNFFVNNDHSSPFLDVTFDGVHILNKDIVSAKPHIQIKLKDDSKFLLMNDTSLSSVQLRYPDGKVRTHHFDNDTLRFTAATSGTDNSAIIDFYPQFLTQLNPEGDEYELIVRGKDRVGNAAGPTEYRIAFTVITKAMISNLLNYPNPFSSSTAFVFTLTGSEIPQNMKIQILTVTGKIVREITKDELGPLRIGRNITDFKWDGTDQFGQKLGNGVYLYRFVTTLNGQRMDKYKARNDNTDQYFNNGYGKMYLMR